MNFDTHYICTVCNKRWGIVKEGADVELTRCEKHADRLSTAEIYAKGLTVGKYNEMVERQSRIRGRR